MIRWNRYHGCSTWWRYTCILACEKLRSRGTTVFQGFETYIYFNIRDIASLRILTNRRVGLPENFLLYVDSLYSEIEKGERFAQ
jgi:hypothetical protein